MFGVALQALAAILHSPDKNNFSAQNLVMGLLYFEVIYTIIDRAQRIYFDVKIRTVSDAVHHTIQTLVRQFEK